LRQQYDDSRNNALVISLHQRDKSRVRYNHVVSVEE
jgi:hypothetical protein